MNEAACLDVFLAYKIQDWEASTGKQHCVCCMCLTNQGECLDSDMNVWTI